ncbi:hypothetical protein KM043_017619 [Ampulex compressa]|nr:hypothetical protein KM043_017619 [Ampulex compressa]
MHPVLKILLGHCWGNVYLITGICIGLSVNLFLLPAMQHSKLSSEELKHLSNLQEYVDEYEPRITTKSKLQIVQKPAKTLIRPRYYSTELGIREKLFIGIITSQEHLYNRDVALNKTLAHLVDKVHYFISIPEGNKPNVSLPGIVGFTDTRSVLKPYHAIKYIIDNYLDSYDFYFLIKDVSFVNARALVDLVRSISVSQDVHAGVKMKVSQYCSLDSGILLSNSIVQGLKTNLDWCVGNAFSDLDDINFGRCILHASSLPCSDTVQGYRFSYLHLQPMFTLQKDFHNMALTSSDPLVVFPIYDHTLFYEINAYFAASRAAMVHKNILKERESILNSVHLVSEQRHGVSWPVGNKFGNKASGRFDVLRWIYFNRTHTFFETDLSGIQALRSDIKADVEYVISLAVAKVLADDMRGKEERRRIEVCKPLGAVEILPVPYVTENTRINLVLIIDAGKRAEAVEFLKRYAEDCMEKRFKTFLMLVLLYNTDSPSKGKEDSFYKIKKQALMLTARYKKIQSKVTWLSIRLPANITSVDLEPTLKIAVTDLCARKFSPHSLLHFLETRTRLRMEYLNRVRMNTINQYQIYSPIPFVEFHPDIIYTNIVHNEELDVSRNYGRYDEQNYNNIAFYVRDYITMRRTVEASLPMAHTDKDIPSLLTLSQALPLRSVLEMFLSFSELHVLRAAEPALKIRYKLQQCSKECNKEIYEACIKSKSVHLGRRGQLAKLLLEYRAMHRY